MKKLLLILLLFANTALGYFEINEGVVTHYSDDGLRSWSMGPSLTSTTVDWIWPDALGASGQTIHSDGTSTLIWGVGTPTSLTDGGILLGNGTGNIVALGVALNGQIPIGDGVQDPVLATITEGLAIDITNGAGSITVAFDPTELDDVTWSDGANASNTWTFDVSGTDHTMIAGSALMTFSEAVTVDGQLTVGNGGATETIASDTTGTSPSIFFSSTEISLAALTTTIGDGASATTVLQFDGVGSNAILTATGPALAAGGDFTAIQGNFENLVIGTGSTTSINFSVGASSPEMTVSSGLVSFNSALNVDASITGNSLVIDTDTLVVDAVNHLTVHSGHVILKETGDDRSGVYPSDIDPHLRVFSSDVAQATDYVEMYHDQTRAVITAGGELKITQGGSTSLVFGNGVGNFTIDTVSAIEYKVGGTPAMIYRFNTSGDWLNLGLYDNIGNQYNITNSANANIDHDHALQTDPTLFIHSDFSPNVSNNQWGSFHHDQEDFIIETGVATGTGSAPTTGRNAIILSPRGTEELRAEEDLVTVANDLIVGGLLYTSTTELTISGGAVTVTQGHHSIDTEGDTANDDLDTINGGNAGEILLILPNDDNRTVRIRHGIGNIFLKHQVVSKSYSFSSPAGSSGVFYSGGYYNWSSTDGNLTQASLSVTHSAADSPSACHIGIVAGGAGVVDTGVVKITVSGTTIDDEGNRLASQTVDLVADITALSTDQYVETTEKWLGQVTIALATVSGSPVNFNVDINYGCSKYEDFSNQSFTINVLEVVGLAGATDTGFNLRLFHHSSAGWTYAASGFTPGGTVLANMNTDYSTEQDLSNGESFAYKRVNLNTDIAGDDSEGLVLEITTGANKAVEIMDLHLTVNTAPNFSYMSTTKQHLIFMKHGANWLEL